MLIVITKNYHEDPHGYEWPDIYTVEVDDAENPRERAEDILKHLHQNYLKTAVEESVVAIDHKHSYCNRQSGYGQIVWENGDIHQYFLVEDVQRASEVLREYLVCQEKEVPENSKAKEQGPIEAQNIPCLDNRILSLSTVHVHPNAVDFLSVPMSADALQIFPNSDQCVMHIADSKAVDRYDMPSSIKDCIRYADKHGCSWIHFSYEGKENMHLPTYRAAWDRFI